MTLATTTTVSNSVPVTTTSKMERPSDSPKPTGGLADYSVMRTLGKGSFGLVKLVKDRPTGAKYAIKIISKELMSDTPTKLRTAREIRAMEKMKHESIIRFEKVLESNKNIYVVMEYAAKGELFDFIISRGRLDEKLAGSFFIQMVRAVQYLHTNSVVHRDLKPENFLLTSSLEIKLSDFGFCNHIEKHGRKSIKTPCGSPTYAAPEIFRGELYDETVDIWSLGVNLFVMITGTSPWGDDSTPYRKQKKRIQQASYHIPSYVSDECRSLIQALIEPDATKRLSFTAIFGHPWMVKYASEVETPTHPVLLQAQVNRKDTNHSITSQSTEGPSSVPRGEVHGPNSSTSTTDSKRSTEAGETHTSTNSRLAVAEDQLKRSRSSSKIGPTKAAEKADTAPAASPGTPPTRAEPGASSPKPVIASSPTRTAQKLNLSGSATRTRPGSGTLRPLLNKPVKIKPVTGFHPSSDSQTNDVSGDTKSGVSSLSSSLKEGAMPRPRHSVKTDSGGSASSDTAPTTASLRAVTSPMAIPTIRERFNSANSSVSTSPGSGRERFNSIADTTHFSKLFNDMAKLPVGARAPQGSPEGSPRSEWNKHSTIGSPYTDSPIRNFDSSGGASDSSFDSRIGNESPSGFLPELSSSANVSGYRSTKPSPLRRLSSSGGSSGRRANHRSLDGPAALASEVRKINFDSHPPRRQSAKGGRESPRPRPAAK